ncbi:putative kinase Y4mE [Citricoccus zhacaiensis]|uniref:Kinase Y4mE n=1 Tax=Citricoccus zhacaiensis TaxID=489142 RepID=A0ABQ2M3C7_9MICC|nr:HipA domain-containing protein [Citricoccus zhacaiensis]GGO46277.1 putative kinase Y4mE [Citricoccus zhacaiensis]
MSLTIWIGGVPVATLEDAGARGGASLRYTDQCRAEHPDGTILLSIGMPVRAEPYPGIKARHFLDGLLPEDHVRDALARRKKLDSADTYGLLQEYGLDCAGAVQITDMGTTPDPAGSGVHLLTERELVQAVRGLPAAPLGTGVDHRVRSSLGGMQGKLTVVEAGGQLGLPLDGAPSTHILKPARLLEDGSQEWPGVAQGENFCLQVIRQAHDEGLVGTAAASRVRTVGHRDAILVERFDRATTDAGLQRIHQEDLAQALGISTKYQKSGIEMPRLRDVAGLLAKHSDLASRRALLERVLLGYILGDCDMHSRNLTVVLSGGRVDLSPAYDVVPTSVWPNHDRELSLWIGHSPMIDDVEYDDFLTEATGWGLRASAVRRTIREVCQAASTVMPRVIEQSKAEEWHHPILDDVMDQATGRIAKIAP